MDSTNFTAAHILFLVDGMLHTIERERKTFTTGDTPEKIIIEGIYRSLNQIRLNQTAHSVTLPDLSLISDYIAEGLKTAYPEGTAEGTPEILTLFKLQGLANSGKGQNI